MPDPGRRQAKYHGPHGVCVSSAGPEARYAKRRSRAGAAAPGGSAPCRWPAAVPTGPDLGPGAHHGLSAPLCAGGGRGGPTRQADGLPLCQLVQTSGLERTTVYRLVSALVTAGLLQREPGAAAYRLGNEALALGLAALQRPPLIEQCRPVMKGLARRAGERVFLVARSGDYSHCLHLEEGPRPVCSFAKTVGSLRLLGLGVPSFTLLARMEDAGIAAHYARHGGEYQEHSLTRPKLQRWIAQTREQGYAQITAQGLSGVGLLFALGSCGDAALGFVAPTARIPRSRGPALAALLRQELARL